MSASISSPAALSCLVLVGACGDGGTGPDPNGLIGDWRATKFEVVFDFDGDGFDDDAMLNLLLVRQ
jgi:hypothetical protein